LSNRATYFLLALILGISIVLRLSGIADESLWQDEAFSVYYAQDITTAITLPENTPPLYLTLLSFWMNIGGTSEFSARFPSVLFGVLSVYLTFLLAHNIWDNKKGLLAAALIAVSPYHVALSQEARSYMLLVCVTLLTFLCWRRVTRHMTTKNLSLLAIANAFLLYTHVYGIFILLIQWIDGWQLRHRFDRRQMITLGIASAAVPFLLWSPWIPTFIAKTVANNQQFWITWSETAYILHTPVDLAGYLVPGLLLLAGVAYGIYSIFRSQPSTETTTKLPQQDMRLLLLWLTIPIIIPVIVGLFTHPLVIPRYVISSTIPFILFAVVGIMALPKRWHLSITAILIIGMLVSTIAATHEQQKFPWKTIAHDLAALRTTEPVYIDTGDELLPLLYHFSPACFESQDIYRCSGDANIIPVWRTTPIDLHYAPRIIIVRTEHPTVHNNEQFPALLTEYTLLSNQTYTTVHKGIVSLLTMELTTKTVVE